MYQITAYYLKAILIFVGVSTFALLASCDSLSDFSDEEYVARARKAYTQSDLRASIIELKNALKKNPENPQARHLLGIIHSQTGDGFAAEKELRTALALGVEPESIMLHLAEALSLQGKYQRLLDEIEVLPSLNASQQARLMTYRADALIANDQIKEGLAEYESALSIDPGSPLAVLGKAKILAAKKDRQGALELLNKAIQHAPQEAKLWSFKGDLLFNSSTLKEAQSSYDKAIELVPSNYLDRAKRVLILINNRNYVDASKEIDLVKQHLPNFFLVHYAEGLLNVKQGNFSKAQGPLETAAKLNARYIPTQYFLGLCHLRQNHLEQAEYSLRRFLSKVPNSKKAVTLMALTRFRLNEFERAKAILLPIMTALADDSGAHRLLGAIEFKLGNTAKSFDYFQTAAELNPGVTADQVRQSSKDSESPLETLELPGLDNREPTAFLALKQIRSKQFDQAKATLESIRKSQPESFTLWYLQGIMNFSQGDTKNAKTSLLEAVRLAPGSISANSVLADVYLAEDKIPAARDLYTKLLEKNPGHIPTIVRLAKLDYREEQFEAMEKSLTDLLNKSPNAVQARLLLASYYLQHGQATRAISILQTQGFEGINHPSVLTLLTKAHLVTKNPDKALKAAQTLASNSPRSALPQFLMAQVYAAKRDHQNVRPALERALGINPNFFRARLAMIRLLVQEKDESEALAKLDALSTEFPDDPKLLELQGWVYLRLNQPKQALSALSQAMEKQPSTRLVINFAQAQWQLGDKQAAQKALEDWNRDHPNDTGVRQVRSAYYRNQGDLQAVRQQLEKILEINPKHIVALNDLAWEISQDNPQQALGYAEKAAALAPDSGGVLDTLGTVLLKNAQNQRALEVMEKAHQLARKDLSIAYRLALAQKANDQRDSAIQTLKEILQDNRVFPEQQAAKALLAELTG